MLRELSDYRSVTLIGENPIKILTFGFQFPRFFVNTQIVGDADNQKI
jgi:hypothetical protein